MPAERGDTTPADPVERELQALLADEAERRRPDRIRPRGNQAIEPLDVERGREKLDRVL
jgi:hypothetical protein